MTSPSDGAPSEQEISQAAAVLNRLQPGFLPQELFMAVTRLCAVPILELVPLRRNNGKTEVLLLQRPADDPIWPSQLHTPGTFILSTDIGEGLTKPLTRLYDKELGIKPSIQPVFVDTILHKQARGTEFAAVHYIDLTGVSVPAGSWHTADVLPESIITTQRGFIAEAVKLFEKRQT